MDLKILSGGAMQGLMAEAAPLFQRSAGCEVAVEIGLTSALRKAIAGGAVFDIALLPRADIDALARDGRIADGSVTDIARSAIGVAVRAGAPQPDISTVDAFKRTVLQAGSVTYSDGPSGLYIAGLMDRLGLAEAIKSKTKLTTGPVAELLARGEASSVCSRSWRFCRSRVPTSSGRCRASCKTSSFMLPVSRPPLNTALRHAI